VRKALARVPAAEQRGNPFKAGLYSPDITRQTYRALLQLGKTELARGVPVILDATFRRLADRRLAYGVARSAGVACWTVECTCPESVVRARLERRLARRDGASDADWSVYLQQREAFDAIAADEPGQHLVADTAAPLSSVVEDAIQPILSGSCPTVA
jgi:uncharacterized protein